MLEIDLSLLIVTLFVFMVLIAVLNKGMFQPYLRFMQERDESISRDMAEANRNGDDINSYLEEADKIIANAKHEIAQKREKVVLDAKKLADSKLEARKSELESELKEFNVALEKERVQLLNSLMSQVPLYKETLKAKISKI